MNKEVVLSSITGNEVNVNVGNNTHLKGSLIASGQIDENGIFQDNKNLNFSTNTLTFENLSSTIYSSNQSVGANLNYNLDNTKIVNQKEQNQQSGISSVGYTASNELNLSANKTLATLGQGNITIKDKENSDEIERLNTDTTQLNKELYSSSIGTKVDATLDTRLLSEEGRELIVKDYEKAKKIIDTVDKIVSTKDVSINDFFNEVEKSSKMQDVIQSLIEQNPNVLNSIINSNKSISQNKEVMQIIAMTILNEYGYSLDQIKFVYTDETGQGDKQIQGFITTQNDNIYLNLKKIDNMENMLVTLGQEIAGLTQKNEGVDITTNREEHNKYQDMVSKDLVNDVQFALSLNDNQIDSNTLQTNVNSIEEYLDIQKANSEFALLDKEAGDNNPAIIIPTILAIQSYLNAPDKDEEVKSGMTGSEYIFLPSAGGLIVNGTKELGKKYLGENLKTSVFGATTAAAVNVLDQTATQVAEQMWNQKTFYMNNIDWNEININEKEVIMSGITGFVLAPSMLDTVLDKSKGSFRYSNEAWKKLQKEAYDAKSQSKIDKLQPRIDAHIQNQWNHIKFQGTTYGITESANFIFNGDSND